MLIKPLNRAESRREILARNCRARDLRRELEDDLTCGPHTSVRVRGDTGCALGRYAPLARDRNWASAQLVFLFLFWFFF